VSSVTHIWLQHTLGSPLQGELRPEGRHGIVVVVVLVEVVVVVVVDVVVVVVDVVVVVVPRIGQLVGAGAFRARNRSPSSFTIVPPKNPQKRTPPTSMMIPTPPCGVPPSGYAASPRAESRMERPALSRAEMTAPERLLNL
jgi:hypothetical protein